MASIQELLNSITPGGSTKLPPRNQSVVPKTPQQTVADALKGVQPGGSTKLPPQNQTLLPKQPSASSGNPISSTIATMTPGGSTKVPNPSSSLVADPSSVTGFNTPNRPIPTINQDQAQDIVKNFGVQGFGLDKNLGGYKYTADQAKEMALAKKKELLGAAFANKGPSSVFEVTQLNNIKKASDRLISTLNDTKNDPWKTDAEKKQMSQMELEKVTTLYANEYKDPNEFINAYKSNPNLQGVLAEYIRAGGSVDSISQKIQANSQGEANTGNIQSVTDYLLNAGKVGLNKSGNALAADKYMSSERSNLIDNVNRIAKVPQEYTDLYYGTPEKLGTFEKTINDAKTTIANLTKAYGDSGKSTSEQFDYQINKNKAEGAAKVAELEGKRLRAKTALTQRLAQLGALNTTGDAPLALENLDAQYEAQKTATSNAYIAETNDMVSKKNEAINKLENDLQEKITKISSDLNKSEAQIEKEVFEEEKKAEKDIAGLITSYNTKAKSTYNNFLNTSNKAAQLYIKEFMKTAGGGISSTFAPVKAVKGKSTGTGGNKGEKSYTSGGLKYTNDDLGAAQQKLNSARGADGYVDPVEYNNLLKDWTSGKGLQKDFMLKFPAKQYINPKNTSVPDYLFTGSKAKDTATEGNA